jgi:hypothetical protein
MRRVLASLFTVSLVLGLVAVPTFAAGGGGGGGLHVGKTGQGRSIRLTANARQVRMHNFSIKLQCRDGSVLIDQESGFMPSKVRRNKFVDTQYGSTDKVTYKGAVRGEKVIGTLKVRDRVGKVFCVSPTVKFTTRRK